MKVTAAYLKSLQQLKIEKPYERIVFNKIVEKVDEDLLTSAKVYGVISTYIPLYRPLMNSYFKIDINQYDSMFISRLQEYLVNEYKDRGFNVFLQNKSFDDICLAITIDDTCQNTVSERYNEEAGEKPVFLAAKLL